ncbi:MAG: ThaI family type II restriction endonuclease [Ignavibacteriaceae bacterium]|nr:ThaI family type II restriction endonuclease [Ignavibacteriaceae bacterium]
MNSQLEILNDIGRESYIKLLRLGTNPRGIEMSSMAMQKLL